jgi:hypothetical protein
MRGDRQIANILNQNRGGIKECKSALEDRIGEFAKSLQDDYAIGSLG